MLPGEGGFLEEGEKEGYHFSFHFSSPSPDPLRLTRPARTGVKEGYPLKNGYFSTIGLSSMTRNLSKAHETRESL